MSEIVGYVYQADIHCPRCIVDLFRAADRTKVAPTDIGVEAVLDHAAELEGVNRSDEHSFDTRDFPKVITRAMAEHDQGWGSESRCGTCGVDLLED